MTVAHPEFPDTPWWLVVARSQGRAPWYLLIPDGVTAEEQAWDVMFAYARSFQIEVTWHHEKSELAFQRPHVWDWEVRGATRSPETLEKAGIGGRTTSSLTKESMWGAIPLRRSERLIAIALP